MDHDLDRLLTDLATKTAPVPPSEALMARVLADAATHQPKPAAALRAAPPPARGWFGGLTELFGGGGALAGMSLATVTGVFLGVAQPAPVAALTAVFLSEATLETVDLLPGSTALWAEE